MNLGKIMIVENNYTIANDCRESLESFGYSVTSIVPTIEKSIEKVQIENPDAVLMNIQLPGNTDGIMVAKQMHTRYNIPVVFLSTHGNHELVECAKQVGSFGYLIKPVDEYELCATLKMTLASAKIEQQQKKSKKNLETKVTKMANEVKNINKALNVLLEKKSTEEFIIAEKILANYKLLISPFITIFKNSLTKQSQLDLISIIDVEIKEMVSSAQKIISIGDPDLL